MLNDLIKMFEDTQRCIHLSLRIHRPLVPLLQGNDTLISRAQLSGQSLELRAHDPAQLIVGLLRQAATNRFTTFV
jgi:hypothetical protein